MQSFDASLPPLQANQVPNFYQKFEENARIGADSRQITLEEDKEYASLKNELIEIQLGAE